jgi:hypothetical protein
MLLNTGATNDLSRNLSSHTSHPCITVNHIPDAETCPLLPLTDQEDRRPSPVAANARMCDNKPTADDELPLTSRSAAHVNTQAHNNARVTADTATTATSLITHDGDRCHPWRLAGDPAVGSPLWPATAQTPQDPRPIQRQTPPPRPFTSTNVCHHCDSGEETRRRITDRHGNNVSSRPVPDIITRTPRRDERNFHHRGQGARTGATRTGRCP